MHLSLRPHKFLLVSALDHINEYEHGDDEVECGFAHRLYRMPEEAEVSFVTALGNEKDAYDE